MLRQERDTQKTWSPSVWCTVSNSSILDIRALFDFVVNEEHVKESRRRNQEIIESDNLIFWVTNAVKQKKWTPKPNKSTFVNHNPTKKQTKKIGKTTDRNQTKTNCRRNRCRFLPRIEKTITIHGVESVTVVVTLASRWRWRRTKYAMCCTLWKQEEQIGRRCNGGWVRLGRIDLGF